MSKRQVPSTRDRLLVIDVGNSSTALGVYQSGRIRSCTRMDTRTLTVKQLQACVGTWHRRAALGGAAFASVAPVADGVVQRAVQKVLRADPLKVHYGLQLGAPITYPEPETVGADRLANLAGAVARYRAPVIVVDIGTATTFDIIQPRKGYTGGVIAPGPALMLDYLAEKTALLPRIDLTPVRQRIGKSTEQAMRLGALHGYRGMVKEICIYLMRQINNRNLTLCATGGYARWVLNGMELPFIYDKDLTLYGIGRIYELNRNGPL